MRFSLLLLSLALVLPGAGCQSSGDRAGTNRPQGAEFHTGRPIEPGYAQQLDLNSRWVQQIKLPRGQSIYAAREVGDLLVVVERPRNRITAVRLSDGALVWQSIIDTELGNLYAPVGDDEHIYVNSVRNFYTLDRATGRVNPEFHKLKYQVNTDPLLVGDLALFGSVTGEVFAHDVEQGFTRWAYRMPATLEAPLVLDGDRVFGADAQGNYALLDAGDGKLVWRDRVYGGVVAAPVADRNFIIMASRDQSLYSLLASNGRFRWPAYRSKQPLIYSPIVLDRTIYLIEPGLGLTALDASTGQPRWTSPQVTVPLKMHRGNVLSYTNKLLAELNPQTGEVAATYPTAELTHIVQAPGESLILVTRDGRLHRLDPMMSAN